MNRRRRRSPLTKTFKDYLVPLIGFVVIVVLLVSFFSGDKNEQVQVFEENRTGLDISLNGDTSEAYVVFTGGNREEVNQDSTLYKGEKLVVKSGIASIQIPEVGSAELNKVGEMKFDEDGGISLYSSDMWLNLTASQNVNMRYGSVFTQNEAVLSITQNEAGSTVYMIKGIADVTNLSGKSVVLGKGQKITISRSDAANDDVDLSVLRSDLDDYFKSSEWYIRNNGDFFLNSEESSSSTGSTDDTASGSVATNTVSRQLLNIESPADESTTNFENIAIEGTYNSEDITSITVNGVDATLNSEEKTFTIEEFTLSGNENNLVYRMYDGSKTLIDKKVSTVYYAAATPAARTFEVQNFSLDASKFTFIKPTQNPYTTTEDLVTIQGYVPPGIVNRITVNGFQLGSLTPYGSYWRYHANAEFGNLKEGLNVYKVIYFGREGEVLHTNAFTIIKEKAPEPVAPAVETEITPETNTQESPSTATGSTEA